MAKGMYYQIGLAPSNVPTGQLVVVDGLPERPIICRICKIEMTPDEPRATGGYWQQNISGFVHPKCKQREAIQCQEIDADCNDCLYFVTEKDSKRVRYGSCKRWNINVIACPQQSSAMPCFVHRLTRVEATWNGTISPTDTRVIQKQAQAEKRFLDGTH